MEYLCTPYGVYGVRGVCTEYIHTYIHISTYGCAPYTVGTCIVHYAGLGTSGNEAVHDRHGFMLIYHVTTGESVGRFEADHDLHDVCTR